MSAQPKPNEPSMEEILASIRRIIADDDGGASPVSPSFKGRYRVRNHKGGCACGVGVAASVRIRSCARPWACCPTAFLPVPTHVRHHRIVRHPVGDVRVVASAGQARVPSRADNKARGLRQRRMGAERPRERRVHHAVVFEGVPVAGVRLQAGGLDRHHTLTGRRHRAEKHRVRQVLDLRHHQPSRGTGDLAAHPHARRSRSSGPHPLHTHPLSSWL